MHIHTETKNKSVEMLIPSHPNHHLPTKNADAPGYYYYAPTYYYAQMPVTGELAAPLLPAASLPDGPSHKDGESKEAAHKANPGHLLLCGHAMLMGAFSATSDLLAGKGSVGEWSDNFQKQSEEAADAVTPVGAQVLRQHVFHSVSM